MTLVTCQWWILTHSSRRTGSEAVWALVGWLVQSQVLFRIDDDRGYRRKRAKKQQAANTKVYCHFHSYYIFPKQPASCLFVTCQENAQYINRGKWHDSCFWGLPPDHWTLKTAGGRILWEQKKWQRHNHFVTTALVKPFLNLITAEVLNSGLRPHPISLLFFCSFFCRYPAPVDCYKCWPSEQNQRSLKNGELLWKMFLFCC